MSKFIALGVSSISLVVGKNAVIGFDPMILRGPHHAMCVVVSCEASGVGFDEVPQLSGNLK